MTTIEGIATLEVAKTYRAKDIQMAATVVARTRTILITGAIDTNEHDILVRVELPSAGRWQVVKAETNLTDKAWRAWQITFSAGTTVAVDDEAQNVCRQYAKLFVSDDAERLCFYDGEVRPGEAVLKLFTVHTKVPLITMAHNRPTEEEDEEDIDYPVDPDTLPEARFTTQVRKGFAPRAFIEAWLPVTVVE